MNQNRILLKNLLHALGKGRASAKVINVTQCRHVSHTPGTPDQHIIKSPFPDVPVSSKTLIEYVWEGIDKWPDHTAVICGVTGRSYTYSQLYTLSRRFAASLMKAGFGYRDTLAIVLPNQPEYPLVLMGAVEAGLKVTTVNPVYTANEISRQLGDCEAWCAVTTEECAAKLFDSYRELPVRKPFIIVAPPANTIPEGTVDLRELISSNVDTSRLSCVTCPSLDDVVAVPYSSGTTGLPKGVMLTHGNITTNCNQHRMEPDLHYIDPTTNTHQDVVLAVLPMFHIYGLSFILLSKLTCGVKIVTLPKFEPISFISSIHSYKCTSLFLVPPLVLFLATHPNVNACHLQTVQYIGCSAAPIGLLDAQRLSEKIPNVIFAQGYGMTEASPVIILSPKSSINVASVGKLVCNTEAKIIHLETGASLPIGEVGELCVRGPQVMKGYLNNPRATAETIDEDGWLHTGDLVRCDEYNHFYVHDRLKELIKVKGFQVAPAELEEILRSHPCVSEAAVVGVPESRYGECPRAFVVPKPCSQVSKEELQNFVAEKVSEHKHLTGGIVFLKSIPKNPAGKILRKVIKEQYL